MKKLAKTLLFFIFCSPNLQASAPQRMSKAIAFANGMEVLLVSDSALTKSSMTLLVQVGGMADPKEHKGLAHWFEHILADGSSKFKGPDSFSNYLSANQGSSNAITYESGEGTGYWFEVNDLGFDGSLERFATGISDPVWDEDFLQREKNAVHSEFMMNKSNMSWQFFSVVNASLRDGHPSREPNLGGNLESLKNVDGETTKAFFNRHYSANRMKAILLSKLDLAKLEELANKHFAPFKSNGLGPMVYEKAHFDPKALPQFYKIQTVKKSNVLHLVFELPHPLPLWESKPHLFLKNLLERQDEGSLHATLKKADLATDVYAGEMISSNDLDYSPMHSTNLLFDVRFALTEQGAKTIPKVIESFFAYVHFLQKSGFSQEYFQEIQSKLTNEFRFLEITTGMQDTLDILAPSYFWPMEKVLERPYQLTKFSPENLQTLLAEMTPQKLSAYFLSPDNVGQEKETTYQTPYSRERFSAQEVEVWEKAEEGFSPIAKNEFIALNLDASKDSEELRAGLLIDKSWIRIWQKIDHSYKKPEGQVTLDLIFPKINESSRDMLMAWVADYAYPRVYNTFWWKLSHAGMSMDPESLDDRFTIFLDGYAQKMPQVVTEFFKNFKNLGEKLDQKTFENIKKDMKKNLHNREYQNCAENIGDVAREMHFTPRRHWSSVYQPKNGVDLISGLTLPEFKQYWKELFSEFAIQGLVYGDIDPLTMKTAILSAEKVFAGKHLKIADYTKVSMQKFPEGKPLARIVETNTDNQCWMKIVQLGKHTPKKDAVLRLGQNLLSSRYFDELRTHQQLGYVVRKDFGTLKDSLFDVYLIQSDKYSPMKLEKQSMDWLQETLKNAETILTDELFAELKSNLVESLKQKPETLKDQARRMRYQSLWLDGDFEYYERIAKTVEGLKKEEFIQIYREAYNPGKARTLDIFMHKDKTPHSFLERFEYIVDPTDWKRKNSFY